MGRDFKNFKPSEKCKQNVDDVIKNYGGKSESDLMNDIINKYTEGVKNGTVNQKELDNFISKAQGYLSAEQLQKLRLIVNKLKNI